MNRQQKFGFLVMIIGVITPIVIDQISYKIRTAKAIAEIDAETERETKAIFQAGEIVQALVESGYYKDRSIADIESDFYFYRMAVRFDD